MRTRKEILANEKMAIQVGVPSQPIQTEILLDIRDLLLKLGGKGK